jgi:hypothetical protein
MSDVGSAGDAGYHFGNDPGCRKVRINGRPDSILCGGRRGVTPDALVSVQYRTMRIILTSDLHYNIARSRAPTQAIAREICARGGDLLIFVGDTASTDLAVLDEAFGLFESFCGMRLATAGNHELWTCGDGDSLDRHENLVAAACERSGVHYLDRSPFRANGVAIVGNVGWYDYSFRPAAMGIPLRFYQHKVAPGAADRLAGLEHLVAERGDVPPAAWEVTSRWMDGVRVRLPMSDAGFARRCAESLRHQLAEVHDRAETVIAAIHHLPFAELVPPTVVPNWAFAGAFLGSEALGEVILEYPRVSHVFCGHSHRARTCRKGHVACKSIGSTYRQKCYEVLDV